MKFIIIDDEHELYKTMFADILESNDVIELPKFNTTNVCFDMIRKIYFSEKINRHIKLPQGNIWDKYYSIFKYPYEENEEYVIIFLNGTIRNYFSKKTLIKFKKEHNNVKLALLMYDSMASRNIYRYEDKFEVFDLICTFDSEDAEKYGYIKMNQTFSAPRDLDIETKKKTDAFFIGFGGNRLETLHACYQKLVTTLDCVDFRIVGVEEKQKLYDTGIKYNMPLSYGETLKYEYNTNCIIEVLKPGQSGPTLRLCEAIVFGKKLLTNNKYVLELPFYDSRFIQYFKTVDDIDLSFFDENRDSVKVEYNYNGEFSPKNVLTLIEKNLRGVNK